MEILLNASRMLRNCLWSARRQSYYVHWQQWQVGQLSQTALQGGLVMTKSGRVELGDNIYGKYRSIFNQCEVFGQQRNGNRRKTQNKGYYAIQGHPRSSRVIEVGTNRKPVCDFLLVINSNWHPFSYRFRDIAAYYSNFGHCVFEPSFVGA